MKKKDITYKEIESQFSIENWSFEHIEGKNISKIEKDKIQSFIANKLESSDVRKRYIASSMITEFELQAIKSKLIKRILDKETLNDNGSMTYALGHLNCEDDLVSIFKILATQSFESKNHAYNILCQQIFQFGKEDILKLEEIWNRFRMNPKEHFALDDETIAMVKDGYEGFKSYLDNK